ncbi:uncharacterized protein AMSG_11786 [Thecamonas trahens ATCC 50062]|uniref:Uncharacterized protein n=1 Tax=Thecamonas trahens ATCC 50062 TaxID=461836 RepID=A0A0L0D4W5_THETB|nr:hypothetical protein AMSG_11786 [Thecamonas trahens ATCC 50062]KNC47412.1 hypothetical protein AMSG_11786 [Thecamonas trahens ATCC 50062]|eukprot:XP_013759775.1 hypothetical protein AMSG_11786 [Thecamonas trahens ATCC 50062]
MCDQSSMPITMYCTEPGCASDPLRCLACFTPHGRHHGHQGEKIEDVAAKRKRQLSSKLNQLDSMLLEVDTSLATLNEVMSKLGLRAERGTANEVIEGINRFFDNTIAQLRARETELVDMVNSILAESEHKAKARFAAIAQFVSVCKAVSAGINHSLQLSDIEFMKVESSAKEVACAVIADPPVLNLPITAELITDLPDFPVSIADYGSITTPSLGSHVYSIDVTRVVSATVSNNIMTCAASTYGSAVLTPAITSGVANFDFEVHAFSNGKTESGGYVSVGVCCGVLPSVVKYNTENTICWVADSIKVDNTLASLPGTPMPHRVPCRVTFDVATGVLSAFVAGERACAGALPTSHLSGPFHFFIAGYDNSSIRILS